MIDDSFDFADNFGRDDIHRTRRHIPGQQGNALRVSLEAEIYKIQLPLPCSIPGLT